MRACLARIAKNSLPAFSKKLYRLPFKVSIDIGFLFERLHTILNPGNVWLDQEIGSTTDKRPRGSRGNFLTNWLPGETLSECDTGFYVKCVCLASTGCLVLLNLSKYFVDDNMPEKETSHAQQYSEFLSRRIWSKFGNMENKIFVALCSFSLISSLLSPSGG